MAGREVIELHSDQSEYEEVQNERRVILEPVIRRVVHALGGYESGKGYQMGDEVAGCLKDLKKLWRKDDDDDDRTVARIFWETRVLPNDLVHILLATAGKGQVEDKRAIACADLMTAMTWPIDMAEELKELDEELDKGADFTQLLQSHLQYKAALLKPGVMQALFGIMIPPLAKSRKDRTERDGQVINVVLHLIRNLAFIKDLPFNSHLSSDQAEFSNLQNKLIKALEETKTLRLLLTVAANTDADPLFNSWNTLILEIFYLLFRGTKPRTLTMDPEKQGSADLHRLLAAEDKLRREVSRSATSRHSRFGTTITVKLNPKKVANHARSPEDGETQATGNESHASSSRSFVLHRQQAIHGEAAEIMDMKKRQTAKKGNKVDEMAREDNLSVESRGILQRLATEFIQACFNPFLSTLLKDIRSERAKISEKDNLRLLFITKWFLEFFLSARDKAKGTEKTGGGGKNSSNWSLGLIAEVTERYWIVWVLKRMREAVEDKPKLWTELQAGIECLTQLLFLIDAMSSGGGDLDDSTLQDAAEALRHQIIYNGEVLDAAVESLKTYKPGTQSLAYLDSSVNLSYALFKMLERWGKGDVYVRKKKAPKKKAAKGVGEEDGIPDVEEEEVEREEIIQETMFTFEAFEMKFAHSEINHTLLTYLARYREFTSSDNLRRVVSLLHRQAVKAKAEGLFFQVSTLYLFKTILADQKSFPRDQPHKDLINLVTFILRQFFKAVEKEPFLGVEVFFPMNRNNWKQYSSWEPEEKKAKAKERAEKSSAPHEVVVKKGHSWSEELGITIALLMQEGRVDLVNWTKDILTIVIGQRQRIIEETDSQEVDLADDDDLEKLSSRLHKQPSKEAMSKMTDYEIPYLNDDQANSASRNPLLKLLFRLSKFAVRDEAADEFEWFVPASIIPTELDSTLVVIDQFIETPFDLEGKKSTEFLAKKRRRRRREPIPSDGSDAEGTGDDEGSQKKKAKRKKEKEVYKSAQFIEDSDEEYGDMDAFLEKEKDMRERAIKTAAAAGVDRPTNMKATGTKKRRRKGEKPSGTAKRQKSEPPSDHESGQADSSSDGSGDEEDDVPRDEPAVKVRPRPRPIAKSHHIESPPVEKAVEDDSRDPPSPLPDRPKHVGRKNRLVLSEDEDE